MADITQADLEAKFTPQQVRKVFADDGSATPGPRLAAACEEASKIARAILRKSWPSAEALDALIAGDAGVRGAICTLAMEIGADAHPEWLRADGKGMFTDAADRARKTLEAVAKAELRPESETTAGANPTYQDRITLTEEPEPQFLFAPSQGKRPRGGF